MAKLTLNDLANADLQNAISFVKAIRIIFNEDDSSTSINKIGNFNNYADLNTFAMMMATLQAQNTNFVTAAAAKENNPFNENFYDFAGFTDLVQPANIYDFKSMIGDTADKFENIFTNTTEMCLWLGGFLNFSDQQWESDDYIHISETKNSIKNNGVLTLFAKVASEIYLRDKYNVELPEDFNILETILTKEVYDDFLKIDALAYLQNKPLGNLQKATEIDIPLDLFGAASTSEKRSVTYMDFLAFVQKYPQVFALGTQREKTINILKTNGTILVENFNPNDDPRLASFTFLSSLPAFSGIVPPLNRNNQATHYVKKLSIKNEEALAIVRTDYCPSDTDASFESIDIKLAGEYQADQDLFRGNIEKEIPPETQVRVLKRGIGKGGYFNKINLFDENGNLLDEEELYIDSRVLAKFPTTEAEEEEDQLVNWLCGLFKNGVLPVVEVPEPNDNFFVPDWRERDKCQPFLNLKTNEYWITIEQNISSLPGASSQGAEFDIPVEDLGAAGADLGPFFEAAAAEGLQALLEYYGKVSGTKTVQEILHANLLSRQPQSKRYDGNVLNATEYFSDNRGDNKIKILVKVDRSFFEAEWLKQEPRTANTLSFQQYKEMAPEGIVPILEINTNNLEQKIKTLISNIDKEFKPRIRKYIASTGDQNTFKDLSKVKERLNSFSLVIKRLMTINNLQFDDSKKDKLVFGFTKELEPLFVAYAPEPTSEAGTTPQYAYRYLTGGITCLKSIPGKDSSIFADQTSLGYMLYADKLNSIINDAGYQSILQKEFAGIKLVQKFTIPSPTLKPSKKEDAEATRTTRKRNPEDQADTNETNPKTREDIQKENEEISRTVSVIKKETNTKTYNAGDDVAKAARPVIEGAETAEDLYTFLQLISIREFIIKATVCLRNSIDPTSAIDAATIGILNSMSPLSLLKMMENGYFLNELSKRIDPAVLSDIQSGVTIARESARIGENISNIIKILEEHPTASQDFLNATKETARYYNEDFDGDINDVAGAQEITKTGEALQGATEVKAAKKIGEQGLPEKQIDTPRLEVNPIDFNDDAIQDVDEKVEKGIDNSLNVTVLAAIKTSLEAAVFVCEEINQQIRQMDASIAAQLNTGLNNTANLNTNSDDFSDLIASINDEEISRATSDSLMNLANLQNIFDAAGDTSQINQAGNLDVESLIMNAENIDANIRDIFENSNSKYPVTSEMIEELKQLLDYMSGLLRPSEICSLFSYGASPKTLGIVLSTIQDVDLFFNLRLFIKNTDDVAEYFEKLGKFIDTAYCSTVVRDLTLITILCEKEIKDQAYREALQNKGFSDEQIDEIFNSGEKINKEKLQKLEEILAYDEIADYFQSAFDEEYGACSAASIIDNDYMNTMINEFLESLFATVSDRFNLDVLGAKSVLIQEEFTQYDQNDPNAPFRYPVLGRDYNEMFNGEDPVLGAEGTPFEGVEFFDDRGLPITTNFPKQDKVEQLVAPRLKDNLGLDQSNILKQGNINIDNDSNHYKKYFSNVEIKSAGTVQSYEELLIDSERIDEVLERIEEINDELSDVIGDLEEAQSDVENYLDQGPPQPSVLKDLEDEEKKFLRQKVKLEQDRDQALVFVEQSQLHNQIVEQQIAGETLLGLTTLVKTENLRLVDHQVPRLKNINGSIQYSKFNVTNHGKFSFDKQESGINTIKTYEIDDVVKKNETFKLLKRIYENEYKGTTTDQAKESTLPEFSFSKIIVKSLANAFPQPSQAQAYIKSYRDLEKNVMDHHQILVTKLQRDIFNQSLHSSLFDVKKLSSLILGSQSDYMKNILQCSDNTNPDLKKLRDGMLDLGSLEKLIKDYYKKIACETFTRPPDDPGPFNDAVQYGMAILLIRLTLAQVVIRSIFFFSRFSAKETLTDSPIYLSYMYDKLKQTADLLDPELYDSVKEIAVATLERKVKSKIQVDVISNLVFHDSSRNPVERRYTNFENKNYNLADLEEIEKDLDLINVDILENIAINMGLDPNTNSVFDIRSILRQKITELALKDMINDNTKTMADLIDDLLLDKDRKYDQRKYLLASDILFDVPSQLSTLDDIKLPTQKNPEYSPLPSQAQAIDLYEQETGLAQGTVAAAQNADPEQYEDLGVLMGFDLYYQDLVKKASKAKYVSDFPATLYSFDEEENSFKFLSTSKSPLYKASESPVVINFNSEEQKNLLSVDAKNISTDAFSLLTNTNNSYFYNNDGNLTDLGFSTKDGGFILQRYLKIKFSFSKQYIDEKEMELHAQMIEAFQRGVGLDNTQYIDSNTEIIISYKNFDFGLYEALKVLQEFDFEISSIDSDVSPPQGDPISFVDDFNPQIETLPSQPANIENALNKAKINIDNTSISYLFDSIDHGVRLVYVAPHNVDILDPNQDFVNVFTDINSNDTKILQSCADGYLSSQAAFGTFNRLIKESVEGPAEEEFDFTLRDKIFNHRTYQIKELVKYGSGGAIANDADLGIRKENFRTLKTFHIIPIENALIERDISISGGLNEVKFKDFRDSYGLELANLSFNNASNYQKISSDRPIVQKYGVNAAALVDELFDLPTVDLLNNFSIPTSTLMSFGIFHQVHFPYDDTYNYDKMFLETRKIAADILKSSAQNRNNWEKVPEPEGVEGKAETFNEAMDKALSFADRDNAFLVWCAQLVPKLILRYIVKQVDPGMKYFMAMQEAEGLPDTDLLKMIINPFGVRPTPIWPPGFPVFGNPAFNLTPMGLLYAVLAPLPIGVPQFNDIEEQEQELPPSAPDVPTIGNPFGAGEFTPDPTEECKT